MKHLMFATFLVGALTQRALAEPDPPAGPADPDAGPVDPDAGPVAPDPAPAAPADDLAQAADATAEVAAVAAPAPDAAKPSSDDIDLSALGLDPGVAAFDDKLNIYGFADVGFFFQHLVRRIPPYPQDTRSFGVGNLNVYLAKNLTPRARALAEIRFTFMPNGSLSADNTYVNTTAQDLANFTRPTQWGGIVIERAHVEYDLTDHLTIRGGHWLTPYGIWNIDHGSPVIVAAGRPYVIGEEFFPEHQTGLELFGSRYAGGYKLGYHLTMSNGRGTTEAVIDQDDKLAFGGRVEVVAPWGVRLGGSYFRGRYTALPPAFAALPDTFREASYGGDAQLRRGAFHIQAEAIAREHHYISGERAATAAGFAPDGRDFGFYVLADYRFERFWNVMPFAYIEREDRLVPLYTGLYGAAAGLNFRPAPSLVLKIQLDRTKFDDGPELLAGHKVYYFAAQAAWVF